MNPPDDNACQCPNHPSHFCKTCVDTWCAKEHTIHDFRQWTGSTWTKALCPLCRDTKFCPEYIRWPFRTQHEIDLQSVGTPDRECENSCSQPPNTIKGNVYIAYDWKSDQGGDKALYLCVDTNLTDEQLKAGFIVMIDRVRGSISTRRLDNDRYPAHLTHIVWLLGAENIHDADIRERFSNQYNRVMPQAIAYMKAFDNWLIQKGSSHRGMEYEHVFPEPFTNNIPSHAAMASVTEVRTRIVPYVLEDAPRFAESFSYYIGTERESAITGRRVEPSNSTILDMHPKEDVVAMVLEGRQ